MALKTPLSAAFATLRDVRHLAFEALSAAAAATGWAGSGRGTVAVERPADDTLVFREQGTWTPAVGRPSTFTNVYRWTLGPHGLTVAHLRFGPDRPVELFDLVPDGPNALVSEASHACGDDQYAARLTWAAGVVSVTWTVTGPGKAERIGYTYRP